MPNKANARKALRQAKVRATRNLKRKDAYKNAIKSTLKAEMEQALGLVKTAQQALDKAAKNGVIKKKTAARKLSRLMKKINAKKKK